MIIGVDASCWSNNRGFGRFTRELLRSLCAVDAGNRYVFFVDDQTARNSQFPPNVEVDIISTGAAPTEAASSSGRRSLGDMWAFTRQVLKHKLDIFFFPAVYTYYPILNRTKIIVTLHDVIAEHLPGAIFPNKKLMYFWKLKQHLALRQARMILTVSQYSKQAICNFFHVPPQRVEVTPEGANPAFRVMEPGAETEAVLRKYGLNRDDGFLLYVGGISPHKNLGRLVEAFHDLIEEMKLPGLKLALVGDYQGDAFYSDYPRLKQQIRQLNLQDRVVFTGYVEDAGLAHLYNAASMLVFPSLEEGFGLPAVEAMYCGTPVAASNRGSLPEILGDAGELFEPTSPEAIRLAIRRVLTNPALREEMKHRNLQRAKLYTWRAAAEKMLQIFSKLHVST